MNKFELMFGIFCIAFILFLIYAYLNNWIYFGEEQSYIPINCWDETVEKRITYTINHHINSVFTKSNHTDNCPEGFISMSVWWLNCQTDYDKDPQLCEHGVSSEEYERIIYEEWVCANQTTTDSCPNELNEIGECWVNETVEVCCECLESSCKEETCYHIVVNGSCPVDYQLAVGEDLKPVCLGKKQSCSKCRNSLTKEEMSCE